MHGSMERQYTCALNELHFSEEDRARMTQKLLNAKQAKRPPHRHLRTALAAAAACAALTATALAAAPGIREALQARQGAFAPYAQEIDGAACTDQGIEVRIVSALSDDVRGWVYYTVRDTEGDRLDQQLALDGEMTVSTETMEDALKKSERSSIVFSSASLENDQPVSYDPDTKTALFAKQYWFGDDFEPAREGHFSAVGMSTRHGHLGAEQNTADCSSVTGETLESLPAAAADEVIFRPGDVEGAPYGNEVLPEEVVVLAPGQNRVPVQGSDDIWVSAMGIAGDGCFHVRLAFAEGVEAERDWNVAAFPRNEEDYGAAHFTAMIRRVENGLDILFPLLHAGEAERLDHIWFAGSYTRPGTEIAGGWSMDFPFVYHASKTLDWIGEIGGHQVTQATVSPLNVTMRIRGDSDIGEWRDMTARLRDGTVVETSPGTSSHMNRAAWENDSEEQWEIYSTWAFSEPVDVEDIVSLTVMGVTIPVEAG